jgi:peptide-methionine (S)-S-oxide reductase
VQWTKVRLGSLNALVSRATERSVVPIKRERAGEFDAPLVTELVPLEAFCVAEDYHHDSAARNPDQPYIHSVAQPKTGTIVAYKEHQDEEVQ